MSCMICGSQAKFVVSVETSTGDTAGVCEPCRLAARNRERTELMLSKMREIVLHAGALQHLRESEQKLFKAHEEFTALAARFWIEDGMPIPSDL